MFMKHLVKPLTRQSKRFFSYKPVSPIISPLIIMSPLIGSMFIVGALYTHIIVSELKCENLYMKRYHEEIIERLKRIERK